MIQKIHSRSLVEDVSTTATAIINDFSKRDFTSDSYLSTHIPQLVNYNQQFTQAINEKVAGSILFSIDEKRDDSARVVFYELMAKIHWPEPEIRQAAQKVMDVLDKYGMETLKMSYSRESANINALLEDFKKPEIEAAIQQINGMERFVNQLAADQKEFEMAYLEHVGQKLEHQELLSATKWRGIIRTFINKQIGVYLNAMSQARPVEYGACAEVIAAIIDDNNRLVRNRLNRGEGNPDVSVN